MVRGFDQIKLERLTMASITFTDIADIQRMHSAFGRGAALAEVKRRWRGLSDSAALGALDRILASPSEPPPDKKPARRPCKG